MSKRQRIRIRSSSGVHEAAHLFTPVLGSLMWIHPRNEPLCAPVYETSRLTCTSAHLHGCTAARASCHVRNGQRRRGSGVAYNFRSAASARSIMSGHCSSIKLRRRQASEMRSRVLRQSFLVTATMPCEGSPWRIDGPAPLGVRNIETLCIDGTPYVCLYKYVYWLNSLPVTKCTPRMTAHHIGGCPITMFWQTQGNIPLS